MAGINYFQIYGKYLKFFKSFDPYDFLFELNLKGGFAIGASRHLEGTADDVPAGLMIAEIDNERITVKWIYVEPQSRGMGIGTQLMQYAFEESAARGFERLAVRVTGEYTTNGLGWKAETFFNDLNFDSAENELPEWSIKVTDLYDEKDGYTHVENSVNIVPLSEMREKEVNGFYTLLKSKYKKQINYDVDIMRNYSDPMISYAWIQGKDLKGYLITVRSDENIYPVAFMANNPNDELTLAASAIAVSEDCAKPEDVLRVKCMSFGDEELMKRLSFASDPIDVKYFTADVKEYISRREAK